MPHYGQFGKVLVTQRLIDYLQAHRGDARFLVATTSAQIAAPIILVTGEPVMALGGFSGGDRILTTEQLAARIANGEVRFFLLSPEWGQQPELSRWIRNNCKPIAFPPPRQPNPGLGGQQLYDCAK